LRAATPQYSTPSSTKCWAWHRWDAWGVDPCFNTLSSLRAPFHKRMGRWNAPETRKWPCCALAFVNHALDALLLSGSFLCVGQAR
jgi:hypothetical protein